MTGIKIKPLTEAEATAELEAAKKIKGDNGLTVNAYCDPDSYVVFKVKQGAVDYFKIKRTIATSAVPYEPRQAASTQPSGRVKTEGAAQRSGTPRGKLIRIPVNPKKPPADQVGAIIGKLNGARQPKLVDRKFYYFRVPPCMSINAIALMINTQFGENKPDYFVTPAGKKWFINTEYKDKGKLPKIGKNAGKPKLDVPEDKNNVDPLTTAK